MRVHVCLKETNVNRLLYIALLIGSVVGIAHADVWQCQGQSTAVYTNVPVTSTARACVRARLSNKRFNRLPTAAFPLPVEEPTPAKRHTREYLSVRFSFSEESSDSFFNERCRIRGKVSDAGDASVTVEIRRGGATTNTVTLSTSASGRTQPFSLLLNGVCRKPVIRAWKMVLKE